MHTIDLLEQAVALAKSLGYSIRQEWLGGSGGGGCEIRGRKWLFIDLALTPAEQFEQVIDALRADPQLAPLADGTSDENEQLSDHPATIPMSRELSRVLHLRKSA